MAVIGFGVGLVGATVRQGVAELVVGRPGVAGPEAVLELVGCRDGLLLSLGAWRLSEDVCAIELGLVAHCGNVLASGFEFICYRVLG